MHVGVDESGNGIRQLYQQLVRIFSSAAPGNSHGRR